MKINYRRKTPKRRLPTAPGGFRHSDKKKEQLREACRSAAKWEEELLKDIPPEKE